MRSCKKKIGRYGSYDRCGRYGGYDALRNASHGVRLDEQSKDPKRSPESPHPMSEENQNRNPPTTGVTRARPSERAKFPICFLPLKPAEPGDLRLACWNVTSYSWDAPRIVPDKTMGP